MNAPEKETGRTPHQGRPESENHNQNVHAADASIVASSRRQLPQWEHCDLGLPVDDGSEVGS
jgi:hypothetical protein